MKIQPHYSFVYYIFYFLSLQNTSESCLTQQYEEQLTELHCVIAELSRKLEAQKNLVITEEDELTDTQSIVEDEGEAERNGEETSDEILEKNFESISMPNAENVSDNKLVPGFYMVSFL